MNKNILNKIQTILELVTKLNSSNKNIALQINKDSINLFDINNNCKPLIIGKRGYIYLEQWNNEDIINELNETIIYLEELI